MNLQLCVIACSGAGGILSGVSHVFLCILPIHVDLVVLVPAFSPCLSLASLKVWRAEVPSCLCEALEMRDVSLGEEKVAR